MVDLNMGGISSKFHLNCNAVIHSITFKILKSLAIKPFGHIIWSKSASLRKKKSNLFCNGKNATIKRMVSTYCVIVGTDVIVYPMYFNQDHSSLYIKEWYGTYEYMYSYGKYLMCQIIRFGK